MKSEQSRYYTLKFLNGIDPNYKKVSRSIYRLSNDKIIMIRYSKLYASSKEEKDFFFGIAKNEFEKYHNNLFIIFICASNKLVFVLPSTDLLWLYNCRTAQDKNWKLRIKEESQVFYLYKYGEDREIKKTLSTYKNNYNLFLYEESNIYPQEVNEYQKYYEGATTQITVNIYERNRKAREKCLKHYGLNCCICGFNFEKFYGAVGKDFMQVHHIKPLSEIKEEYELDPINDLLPVCPNCHAIIHRHQPPYTLEEMQSFINQS